MKQFIVSALVEGYRIEESFNAVSVHHAIKFDASEVHYSTKHLRY